MRDLVIHHIQMLLEELGAGNYHIMPWNQYSNLQLLELYGDLRIDLETEEYDE